MSFSNPSRRRQEIAALAGRHTPPMYRSWGDVPLEQRLLILEHISSVIEEATRESDLRPFRVRIDFGVTINSVVVRARNHEEAFAEAKRVLKLEGKDVDGTVVPQ